MLAVLPPQVLNNSFQYADVVVDRENDRLGHVLDCIALLKHLSQVQIAKQRCTFYTL